ncbi:aspartate carbamoyltransferase [Candidatus Peregrinibacteria bacterium]|nr:aspartate carbamoyltransferase [Candidatus Peregrinibacteria bacterium]
MKRTQLITTADLLREEVDFFIHEAERLRDKRTSDLSGKIVASLFLEPSTRTRLSFESATLRLGGHVITVADPSTTSMKKGETLADSIRMVEKYADLLVMRHPLSGAAAEAIRHTQKPFINAGDGANQHPTQALLDLYTIQRELGTIDGLTIGFVGDLKFGRTVHSLAHLLAQYNVTVVLVSPEALRMPAEYIELLKNGRATVSETTDLIQCLPSLDILYMTRVQKERFEHIEDYDALKGSYLLDATLVRLGKPTLRVLHPLPRIDEIAMDVDSLPQAAYFRQAENSVFMRMAILKTLAENYYGSPTTTFSIKAEPLKSKAPHSHA